MAWVKNAHVVLAHDRWQEVWPCKSVCSWSRFLGETYFPALAHRRSGSPWDEITWEINDKGAERIKMLITSPHYATILKAIAVQYVEEIF